MQQLVTSDYKLGILGGGQLGKMLALDASRWDVKTWILDPDPNCSASAVVNQHVIGDYKNYDDVLSFGRQVDIITLEIEHVNTDALRQLKKEGVKILPDPEVLAIIQDKGLQKQFYAEKNIPTSPFDLYESKEAILEAIENGKVKYPFVQKSRTAGYDGKGVAVIKSSEDLFKLLEAPSMVEDAVDIDKEIAVIAARNEKGEIECFPAVEMEFNPIANLVEFLSCPADITEAQEKEATELAVSVIDQISCVGVLAVEMFLDKKGDIIVNEVAPRPHNSGHQTIESSYTSQYQQHLRAVLGFPLGSTKQKLASVMINLLGEPNETGHAFYDGLDDLMRIEGTKVHIYGKRDVKPFRKMGHVTILDPSIENAKAKARKAKDTIKVVAWKNQ